jgi:diadenosine tetraphosphatase ApaH/serine/threonine PP2A family protein phosphatase
VRERLAAGDLAWLSQLPPAMTLEGVLYCHGTPRSDDEIITAATPLDRLREVVRDVDPELIICGHTHHQFERRVDGHRLVNPGSVGMPYEDDVAAFWALVGEDDVEFRRSEFDVQAAAEEIKESGWTDAELFVLENMLGTPSREQAIAEFERRT